MLILNVFCICLGPVISWQVQCSEQRCGQIQRLIQEILIGPIYFLFQFNINCLYLFNIILVHNFGSSTSVHPFWCNVIVHVAVEPVWWTYYLLVLSGTAVHVVIAIVHDMLACASWWFR